jgi:LEA14-like dessication related protein
MRKIIGKAHKTILYFSFVVVLSSCSGIADVKVGTLKDVAVKGFSGSNIQVSVKVPITNNSNFKVKISETELFLEGDGQNVGSATQVNSISLPAHCDSIYKIYFNIDISKYDGGIMSLVSMVSSGSSDFRLKGKVVAKAFLLRKTIKINEELKLR